MYSTHVAYMVTLDFHVNVDVMHIHFVFKTSFIMLGSYKMYIVCHLKLIVCLRYQPPSFIYYCLDFWLHWDVLQLEGQ